MDFPLVNGYYLAAFYLANGCTFFGSNGQGREAGIDLGGNKGVAVTNLLVDLVNKAVRRFLRVQLPPGRRFSM